MLAYMSANTWLKFFLHALQASSPSATQAAPSPAVAQASPAVEPVSDVEPLQIHADRHKTYSESSLAEMETGVDTDLVFWHNHNAHVCW